MTSASNRWRLVPVVTAAAVTMILVGACAEKEVIVRRVSFPGSERTWMGRSESEVRSAWGVPSDSRPDGEGGTILAYFADPKLEVTVRDDRVADPVPPAPELAAPTAGIDRPVALPPKTLAAFWVDTGGRVYRYWFAPKVYKDGRHMPPQDEGLPEEMPAADEDR